MRIGADSSTLMTIYVLSALPDPSSTVSVTVWYPFGSRASRIQPLPIGSSNLSDVQTTLTRSLLDAAVGLQTKPEPLSGKSPQARSQSPEPVESKRMSSPESVSVWSAGWAMTAAGAELFTLT